MFFDEWLKQRAYCKISEIAKPIIKNFQNASRLRMTFIFRICPPDGEVVLLKINLSSILN